VHFYQVAGLTVECEIELPGLIPADRGRGGAEIVILQRPVPAALEGASASGPTWQLAGERFLLEIPNVARFLLRGGERIEFEPGEGVPPQEVAIFLLGTVFGILLHQRQHIVLHASAVRVNGKAVLFCGSSGAGKSTLAAALVQRGYPLVTDDLCAVSLERGPPTVQPDGRQLKLWSQSIERLELAGARGAPVREKLEKFYVEPGAAHTGALPLAAVYCLREARPPHAPGLERPNAVDAALLLRRNAYRPQLVSRMGQKANYFRAATTMADRAGIYYLTRPFDFARMPEVLSWLEDHWREIGLAEKVA
jgi:hypothetical protein